jgi:hypothetical protein
MDEISLLHKIWNMINEIEMLKERRKTPRTNDRIKKVTPHGQERFRRK